MIIKLSTRLSLSGCAVKKKDGAFKNISGHIN